MQLVDDATREGFDFIFNSPNAQSTPGYIKMGWELWGRMPIWLHIRVFNFKFKPQVFDSYAEQLQRADLNAIPFTSSLDGLMTPPTASFLAWRYRDCPVKKYALHVSGNPGNRLWLFFTVKKNKLGMELRICHSFFEQTVSYNRLMKAAVHLSNDLGCRFVTLSGLHEANHLQTLYHGFFSFQSKSVQLTIRRLANDGLYQDLKTKNNWFPETGDIELF
jgi:hypothetical protein